LGRYRVNGLVIESPFALPELRRTETKADVELRVGAGKCVPAEAGSAETWMRAGETDAHLYWRDVGTFVVRGGREVVVNPAATVEPAVIRLFLLGPVLAVLLRQRGLLVLHAAAVELNGGAVVFLGGSGWGKSTLAAALHQRGHALVTDDVAAVDVRAAGPLVLSGVPQLKLWPDAIAAVGDSVDALPRLYPSLDKRARRVARAGATEPILLQQIYALATGNDQRTDRLPPREALVELLRHSFGARTLQAVRTAEHFRHCAHVAARIPVARLWAPRSLAELPTLAQLIEQDSPHAA
jgi:hypothetical protein